MRQDPETPAAPAPIPASDAKEGEGAHIEQGEEITREAFHEAERVNGGVGPQPDEHRGNMFGGFAGPEESGVENCDSEGDQKDGNGDDGKERNG